MKSKIITYQMEASQFEWELAPGKMIEAWGYNNQVPGPVLKARKGDTLAVIFMAHFEVIDDKMKPDMEFSCSHH